MNYQEFCAWILEQLQDYYGEEAQVEIRQIQKNNGIMLSGLLVMEPETGMAPTIYLEEFFSEYENGTPLEVITKRIIHIYEANKMEEPVDFSYFSDYKQVQEQIVYKLIGREKNREMLERVPWVPVLDMALVFVYLLPKEAVISGTIMIYNSHLQIWGIDTNTLYEQAKANTKRLYPPLLQDMETLLKEWMDTKSGDSRKQKEGDTMQEKEAADVLEKPLRASSKTMYVLTNQKRTMGAAVILYEGLLKKLAEEWESDIFILPSSIHECILIPEKGGHLQKNLEEMVRTVNETQLSQEERLSDRVYYYSRREDKILYQKP